jgi:hypothetical protein
MAAKAFRLEILWSTPVVTESARDRLETTTGGLILGAQGVFPDGRIALLATKISDGKRGNVLLTAIERNPEDTAIALTLKGALPASEGLFSRIFSGPIQMPEVWTLAAGTSGDIWVGGSSNAYHDVASSAHSDAYLARVAPTGIPVWEMAYGNGSRRTISNIAALPAGDVAVVGREGRDGRVARIGPDGRQLWERLLGNDLGGAIASLPGDRLAIVGFEGTGSSQNRDYQAHVTAWIVGGSGKTLTQTRIRDAISKAQGAYFGKVSIVTTDDAIYVASNWTGLFDAQPVEMAKLDMDGKLLWKTTLSDTTLSVNTSTRTWRNCTPTFAVTPSDGVLVACALGGQIHLYRIDQASGASRTDYLPSPDCHGGRPVTLFLAVGKDGAMTLSGSRPASNVASSCSWVGRLTAIQ